METTAWCRSSAGSRSGKSSRQCPPRVSARSSADTSTRYKQSHDAQIASAYLATDVQSSTGIAVAACSSGSGVIGFSYTGGAVASYCYDSATKEFSRSFNGTPAALATLSSDAASVAPPVCVNPSSCAPGSQPSKVTINVAQGQTYLVRVAGYGNATGAFTLNVGGVTGCYANCDNSSTPPVLNVADFTCFLQKFAAGCP